MINSSEYSIELKDKKYVNKYGQLHRKDGPAIIRHNGDKEYYLNGNLHREDGPAIERSNGNEEWYLNGKRHRKNGPAVVIICAIGLFFLLNSQREEIWYLNGEIHRENGPARTDKYGNRYWYLNGKLHRESGPAVDGVGGVKEWFLNGKRHREDGPAITRPNGDKEWFLNGVRHREDGPAAEFGDSSDRQLYLSAKNVLTNSDLADVYLAPHCFKDNEVQRKLQTQSFENNSKHWFVNGKRHREDGPAIELKCRRNEWWLNGIEYKNINSVEELFKIIKYLILE